MKKVWGVVLVVVGILLVGAGLYPLNREVRLEEKGVREETWFREETEYREVVQNKEESYTETVTKEYIIEDVILFEKSGQLTETENISILDLRKGDSLRLNVRASSDIVIMLFPQDRGCLNGFFGFPNKWPYTYQWYSRPEDICPLFQGKSFEKIITIPLDGNYSFTIVSMDPFWRLAPEKYDIHLGKVHYEVKTEPVNKTRQVEVTVQEPYIVKTPYTTQVPYTIVTERTEKYTMGGLRYVGVLVALAGAAFFLRKR